VTEVSTPESPERRETSRPAAARRLDPDRLRAVAGDGRWAMGIAAVLALVAGLPGVISFGATLDEAYVYALTRHGLPGVFDGWAEDPQALLPQLVALPFGILGDGTLWVLRLPSLVAFVAAAPLVWWAARPRFTGPVAFTAAVLTALSPVASSVASDARWPAMALLSVVVAWGALFRALDATGAGRPFRWWALYAAALIAGVHANALVLLMVPAHLVAVLLSSRRTYLPWVGSLAVVALGAVPLALAVRASDAVNPLVRLDRPTVTEVPGFAAEVVGGFSPDGLRQASVVVLTILVVAALWSLRGRASRRDLRTGALCLAWAALPTLLLFLVSQGPDSVWEPRYVFGTIPGIALLVAWSASRLAPRLRVPAAAAIVLMFAVLTVLVQDDPSGERADRWAAHLAELHTPGTPVVFYEAEGVQAAGLYRREFRTAAGDPIVPAWDRTPPPPGIVLLDNPTFERLPPGPPDAELLRRLLRVDGTVLLAIRPAEPEPPGVTWARNRCDVQRFAYPYMSIYAVSGCRLAVSSPTRVKGGRGSSPILDRGGVPRAGAGNSIAADESR
jgi:mannosyltransferase